MQTSKEGLECPFSTDIHKFTNFFVNFYLCTTSTLYSLSGSPVFLLNDYWYWKDCTAVLNEANFCHFFKRFFVFCFFLKDANLF